MIGAKLICEGKWGVGAAKNVSLAQSSQELEKSSIDRRTALSQSDFSAQPANLKQDTHSLDSNVESFNAERLKINTDMPQGGEAQGVDSKNGAGVWNMEQNDPDFFMQELNKQGLPYVVLEVEDDGEVRVVEGRDDKKLNLRNC